jgi:hypothetical protein
MPKKKEQAIKITVEVTVPAKEKTKKPWISEATLKLADEKRRLKQLTNVSLEYTQQRLSLKRDTIFFLYILAQNDDAEKYIARFWTSTMADMYNNYLIFFIAI